MQTRKYISFLNFQLVRFHLFLFSRASTRNVKKAMIKKFGKSRGSLHFTCFLIAKKQKTYVNVLRQLHASFKECTCKKDENCTCENDNKAIQQAIDVCKFSVAIKNIITKNKKIED